MYIRGSIALTASVEPTRDFDSDYNFKGVPFVATGKVTAYKPLDFDSVLFEVAFRGSGKAEGSFHIGEVASARRYSNRKIIYSFL